MSGALTSTLKASVSLLLGVSIGGTLNLRRGLEAFSFESFPYVIFSRRSRKTPRCLLPGCTLIPSLRMDKMR